MSFSPNYNNPTNPIGPMFKQFFFSEIRYNLRQPMVYLFFLIVFLLVFAANSTDNVQIGGSIGNVNRNAPHVITVFTTVMSIFGLLFAAAFFNNAALRDRKYDFQELLFSKPIDKFGYYFGRFSAALFLSTLPLLGVFFGIALGSFIAPVMGWIEPDRFGSLKLSSFVSNYLLFVLPNMMFAGSIIYALAHQFKSTVTSFVGALVIIVAYAVSGQFLSDLDNETLGALVDTFGSRTYGVISKYYTPMEKNTLILLFGTFALQSIDMDFLVLGNLNLFTLVLASPKRRLILKSVKAEEENLPILTTEKPQLLSVNDNLWMQFISFFSINFKSIYNMLPSVFYFCSV